jgi:hypothetical protein
VEKRGRATGRARMAVIPDFKSQTLIAFLKQNVALGSTGTKCFSEAEIRSMMRGFENLSVQVAFSPGNLLLNQPSARFRSPLYRLVWKLYPRRLMRLTCRRLGLCLLISTIIRHEGRRSDVVHFPGFHALHIEQNQSDFRWIELQPQHPRESKPALAFLASAPG